MEAAPLTLAQTHARNAVLETRKSNPVAASEEHDLAAGEFAAAAQGSADLEALRTLQLLENHHKRLAQILRFQHEHPISIQAEVSSTLPGPPEQLEVASNSLDPQQQPPRLPTNHRLPPSRESSSIASNLASARGIIPAQSRRAAAVSPTLSSQQAGATMADSPSRRRTREFRLRGAQASAGTRDWDRSSRAPGPAPIHSQSSPPASPTDVTTQQFVPPDAADSHFVRTKTVASDEPFQRFYSTFEGLISKLSAPLAFAGLPLSSESTGHAESLRRKATAETKVDRHNATSDRFVSAAEPDVNRLFSRAALRAIRDTTGKAAGNPAESFYVVPTAGGTVSYAGILSRAEKEARRSSLEEGDDDFVDARETPASPEMRQSLSASRGKPSTVGSSQRPYQRQHQLNPAQYAKTMEELQMENQTLKQLTDTLSKRLHMWEVNAQSSSMALQQSLKAMHHHRATSPSNYSATPSANIASPTATFTGGGAAAAATPTTPQAAQDADQRIKELEDRIRRGEKDLERMTHENEKLRSVLGRYRDRWEKLKEGAKTRRAEGKSGGTSAGAAGAVEPAKSGTAESTRNAEDPALSSTRQGVSPLRAEDTMVDL